jgi:ribulose-phosphate 3-epimerase
MVHQKIIAPSILSADFANLQQQIRSVELGGADWIHCDIMDGQFVPNISFGPLVIKSIRRITKLPLDVHLMIKRPINFIQKFIESGADYITIHQEEVENLESTIDLIKKLGAKAGIALNPETKLDTIEKILPSIDMLLVMSVNPGFGGQSFIQHSIQKIKELNNIKAKSNYDFLIEVDGGIGKSNIKEISEAGCNVFVAGNAIFNSDNISAATIELKNLVMNN